MALFSVLGIALIALLRQSTAFLDRGQAGSEIQDLLENADRRISEDLANVYIQPSSAEGLPDVRFNSWRIGFDTDADGEADAYGQQLSFVRSVQGEAADPTLRAAGSVPGAAAEIDGEDDQAESDRGEHRPAGGKQEVSWLVVPDGKSDRNDATFEPGLMTVYRGERFLVGGPPEKALVPGELPPEKGRPRKAGARYGVTSAREAKERMSPLMTGVLHLSFEFFTRHTLPEAGRLVVDGRLAEPRPPQRGGGGLSPTWDSTRGLLPAGIGPDQFFLAKGPSSLENSVDDVFPAKVRVTLVVDRVGSDARVGELAQGIGPEDTTIRVDSTRFAPGGDPVGKFVKIGNEWIQWSDRDDTTFTVERRGARGTRKETHASGALVRAGATLVRDVPVPAHREDWNE
ncbi:MAG: hypothetical protein L6R43_05280 [Planctomycetes bacterium]|nr:hypothetical protein [Planctomycetota bacterium]